MRLSGSGLAALVVTAFLATDGIAQDKKDKPKGPNPFEKMPRDSYGDPLPDYARGRLGTTALAAHRAGAISRGDRCCSPSRRTGRCSPRSVTARSISGTAAAAGL